MNYLKKQKLLFSSTIRFWIAVVYFSLIILSFPSLITTSPLEYLESFLFITLFCLLLILPEILYTRKSTDELWGKWKQCHDSQEQYKRIKRVFESEVNPYKVSVDSRCAVFVGHSSGEKRSSKYRTTLRKCTCPDFKKRHLPCKHMYYLANECGIDITIRKN